MFYALLLSAGDFFCYTRHEPIGVCGQIIPVSIPNTQYCFHPSQYSKYTILLSSQ